MPKPIYLEVEENANCEYMPLQVYESKADPVPVQKANLFEPDRPSGVYHIIGWSSKGDGTPCAANYVPISDSGQAVAHLIYGGDWGVRIKLISNDEKWDINSPNQWGEPYLILTDSADVILNSKKT